ncbi:MAG: ABC transporter substrate-binding protein, partial [Candidatus Methylomirabilales bacterium]
ASLARPGGNVTGLSLLNPALSGKRLELLKELVAGVSHIAILSNPTNSAVVIQLRQAELAARALGVRIQHLDVRGPGDFERAFQAAIRERAGALLALDDPLTLAHRTQIVALAAKSRLPAIYGFREFAEAGGLMTYGSNVSDLWRRAASYVDKILKGANPADVPVEQPTKFELVINLRTAKALGLTVPGSVLFRADRVIR